MENKFILQGITSDNHLDEIVEAISIPDISRIIISVAFLNQRGFALLSDVIKPNADKAIVIAGIRNGITSAQGLLSCIECGCKLYAVDTGSKSVIFHPKIYFGRSAKKAQLVLGSANLTVGGLNSNIEAGLKIEIDLNVPKDAAFVADLEAKITGIITEFPDHVFEVSSDEVVKTFLATGRLVDEKFTSVPSLGASSRNRDLDIVPKMKLEKKKLTFASIFPIEKKAAPDLSEEMAIGQQYTAPEPEFLDATLTDKVELVWQRNPLTRRSLNIPTESTTHSTGSMFFAKGQTADIDQRHYFREEIFGALDWQSDIAPGKEHLERSKGKFRIVIKGVNYGIFEMSLTHDSRTESATYDQNNSVTQLHWGEVKPLVAHEDLLDRTIYLYRDGSQRDLFILEID